MGKGIRAVEIFCINLFTIMYAVNKILNGEMNAFLNCNEFGVSFSIAGSIILILQKINVGKGNFLQKNLVVN